MPWFLRIVVLLLMSGFVITYNLKCWALLGHILLFFISNLLSVARLPTFYFNWLSIYFDNYLYVLILYCIWFAELEFDGL